MGTAALAARLVLAGIFIVAGVGKLLDLPGSRRALLDFGVGESLVGFGAVALPVIELATAAALLVRPSAKWGAVAALLLLVVSSVGIVNALARGKTPDCHCFGNIHSAPASRRQIVRNGVLAALAGFVVVAGSGSATDLGIATHGASAPVVLLLFGSTFSLLVAVLQLWRERRRLREELVGVRRIANAVPPGLAVGALAPAFTARDANGNAFTLDDLRAPGRPIALVFGAPGCGPCSVLAPEAQRWREALAGKLTIGLVGLATYLRYEEAAARTGRSLHEIYEDDPDLAAESNELDVLIASYRLKATPAAVLVSPDGTIASATVDGRLAIQALIRLAITRRRATGLRAAEPLTLGSPIGPGS